jgi:hypothetical protein
MARETAGLTPWRGRLEIDDEAIAAEPLVAQRDIDVTVAELDRRGEAQSARPEALRDLVRAVAPVDSVEERAQLRRRGIAQRPERDPQQNYAANAAPWRPLNRHQQRLEHFRAASIAANFTKSHGDRRRLGRPCAVSF